MLAVIVPKAGKFVCVVDQKVIGTSKHIDYFEHHYRLRDLRSVAAFALTKFVHVSATGEAESVLSAEALRETGRKSAAMETDSLTPDERSEVLAAFEVTASEAAPAQSAQPSAANVDEASDSEAQASGSVAEGVASAKSAATGEPDPSASANLQPTGSAPGRTKSKRSRKR